MLGTHFFLCSNLQPVYMSTINDWEILKTHFFLYSNLYSTYVAIVDWILVFLSTCVDPRESIKIQLRVDTETECEFEC